MSDPWGWEPEPQGAGSQSAPASPAPAGENRSERRQGSGVGKVLLGCLAVVILALCLLGVVLGGVAWLIPQATPAALPEASATASPEASSPEPTPVADIHHLYRTVVQIIAWADLGAGQEPVWSGSGTLIHPQGYILTNAHVALPTAADERVDELRILITEAEDRPPVPRYLAEVVQADLDLDLAVLRITATIEGTPVTPHTLHLPHVRLGDATRLHLGDPLYILGYPGIGGNTITLTRGEVSGFTAEPGYGERAWIKTSAAIAGGNSGGLAADAQGALVAIPTQLGAGVEEDEIVDCRQLADTNGDGVIDEADTCVPIGGFINALRPVNLALPLIAQALRAEDSPGGESLPTQPAKPPPQEATLFQDDFSDPHSGWDRAQSEDGLTDYTAEGTYRILVQVPNTDVWANPGRFFTGDLAVEVDAFKAGGPEENDFGLICRYRDRDNFYFGIVTSDGYYAVGKVEEGEYRLLTGEELQPSEAIRRGTVTNHLRLECAGPRLRWWANGVLLAEVRDGAFAAGDVGLLAGTYDTPGTDIRFDNLVVSRLTGAP